MWVEQGVGPSTTASPYGISDLAAGVSSPAAGPWECAYNVGQERDSGERDFRAEPGPEMNRWHSEAVPLGAPDAQMKAATWVEGWADAQLA